MKSILISIALATAAFAASKPSELDAFIQTPDPSYKYELVKTIPGDGYTAHVIDMTSQRWPPAGELTDHPLWRHWLTIVRPDQVDGTTGFLFVTGGSVKDAAPARA